MPEYLKKTNLQIRYNALSLASTLQQDAWI